MGTRVGPLQVIDTDGKGCGLHMHFNTERLKTSNLHGFTAAHLICLAQVCEQEGGIWDQTVFVAHSHRVYRDGNISPPRPPSI